MIDMSHKYFLALDTTKKNKKILAGAPGSVRCSDRDLFHKLKINNMYFCPVNVITIKL